MNSEKLREAREKAEDAFWATFAEQFPEITRGDLDPIAVCEFNTAIEKVTDIWMQNNDRIFSGVYPTGIVWADRYKEEHGDYKKLAYLNFGTLKLEIQKDCPEELLKIIKTEAKEIQDKKGEQYQISTSGQKITLGFNLND